MPGLIMPAATDNEILQRDFPAMVLLFILLFAFSKYGKDGRIGRFAGSILLLVYIAYNGLLAYQSTLGIAA